MAIRLPCGLVAFTILSSMTSTNAAVITMYTNGSIDSQGHTIAAPPTELGLTVNLAGALNLTIPLTPAIPGGYMLIDQALDTANNGTVSIQPQVFTAGTITLQNFVTVVPVNVLGISDLTATGTNIGFTIFGAGPLDVSNGSFSIDSSTSGSFGIFQGHLDLDFIFNGTPTHFELNFGSWNPISKSFHDLGDHVIHGTTALTNSTSTLGIDLNGITIDTAINAPPVFIPVTLTLAGHVNLAAVVPEVSSFLVIGWVSIMATFLRRRFTPPRRHT